MRDPQLDTRRPTVVFVPDAMLPAASGYRPLLDALKEEVNSVLKELEVYAAETPPPDYELEQEVEGIGRVAAIEQFHLVGYSAGGAMSLAFAAKYPERVRSLALVEPAWVGSEGWTPQEVAYWAKIDQVWKQPLEQRISAFIRQNLRPGVEPPPPLPNPPPPWMATRPAGMAAIAGAFTRHHLDRERLLHFHHPVYLAVGSLSHSIEERKANVLASLFPDLRVEVYEGRHHFDPPHRAEPERFARALRDLWVRAEGGVPAGG